MNGTTLLAPTTFAAAPGELWCVTGSNGSGKTTLLRAFSGSRSLTGGTCFVLGEPGDLTRRSQRRAVAALVDSVPLARDLTLREQVMLVAASWFGNSMTAVNASDEVLERLQLSSFVERFPHEISAGQMQLFHLALTLVRPAQIVLLDEPERHLDRHRIDAVVELLVQRATQGTTFLMSTHEQALVEPCDGRVELG